MLSSRDIGLLRPDVAANCRHWLERCSAAGLKVLVTSTVRDGEYQAWLYEQGRSRPGTIVTNSPTPTFHSDKAGLAFDFCKNVKGQEYSDPSFFRSAAALAKEMGFSWGGDWKSFPDGPHIQWDQGGRWTSAMILKGTYPGSMPLFSEKEETMTQEAFDKLMDGYLARLREEPPGDWSREARAWAEQSGLFGGDEAGSMQYRMFLTREQLAAVLYRMRQQ